MAPATAVPTFSMLALILMLALCAPAEAQTVSLPDESTTPTVAVLDTPTTATSPTLRLLWTMETFHDNIKTVHAKFHQVRVDELFTDKLESDGELWYRKPYLFRCNFANPQPIVTLIQRDALYNYTKELDQVEYWEFESDEKRDQQLHQLLIGFGCDTEALTRLYTIRSSEDDTSLQAILKKDGGDPQTKAVFEFVPRPDQEESSPFLRLKLYVDKASLLPEKIAYVDPNEADVTLTMKTIETDIPMEDELFDRSKVFPSGVEFINKRNQP